MKHVVIGILAHVDSGKTTLSESLLFNTGIINTQGRVDNKNSFLDTFELERERGITIFAKEARFTYGETSFTLLDTPGHVDFSAEMERTLSVLDYAILVINGNEGLQSHTRTLWKLLESYNIPTFIFVNKMDLSGADKACVFNDIKSALRSGVIDFTGSDSNLFYENIALCSDDLLETFLDTGVIASKEIAALISSRAVFPCFFGSALHSIGVDILLDALDKYTKAPDYRDEFGARVFKISRDDKNVRLTHMKITGGSLKIKQSVETSANNNEKVNQIRLYNGVGFESVEEITAGNICAVTGLNSAKSGDSLGSLSQLSDNLMMPVLIYRVIPPAQEALHQIYEALKVLEDEEPTLRVSYDRTLNEIHVHVMGEIQTEILTELMRRRFSLNIGFDTGGVLYKETIAEKGYGYGHFEPLKHYAEVHLRLEPAKADTGLSFKSELSEDILNRNFQNLILGHLREKEHLGVLTGSALTDVVITLVGGRSHVKHTEGGDFREATYRAVRQALMKLRSKDMCILLEPYYEFEITIPQENLGRVMSDLQRLGIDTPSALSSDDTVQLKGSGSVSALRDYPTALKAATHGEGNISLIPSGYRPAKNSDEIIANIGYNPDADLENPSSSVFCHKGNADVITWDKAEEYLQADIIESCDMKEHSPKEAHISRPVSDISDKELKEIFERTYGPEKKRSVPAKVEYNYESPSTPVKKNKDLKHYLLIDGYNIIYAWPVLKELALANLDAARDSLIEIMCNYQGFVTPDLILVFDAYKRKEHAEEVVKYKNLHIVYTKTAETADQYIEKTVHEIGRKHDVTVATSDYLEQIISYGQGSRLLSAREFLEDVRRVDTEIEAIISEKRESLKNYLLDHADEDMLKMLNEIRLGNKIL